MTAVQELLNLLAAKLEWTYRDLIRVLTRHGAARFEGRIDDFERELRRLMRWVDLAAASNVRYRATRQKTRLPDAKIRKLVEAYRQIESAQKTAVAAGKAVPPRRGPDTDAVLEQIVADNAWFAKHQSITGGLIQKRAEWIAGVERNYLRNRSESVTAIVKGDIDGTIPLFRLDRFRRDAVGEIAQVAQQIQLSTPEVSDAFPFAEYRTREDQRVRPTHAAMDGFVAHRSWDGWPVIRPKCGWACRCVLRFIARHEAEDKGWMNTRGVRAFTVKWPNSEAEKNYDDGKFPDEDWRGPKFWAWPG